MNRSAAAAEVMRLMDAWSISLYELFPPAAEAAAWRVPFLMPDSMLLAADIEDAMARAGAVSYPSVPAEHGLYLILNSETGRFYLGSSVNMRERLRAHLIRLRMGSHENKALQDDFKTHGQDNLRFAVVALTEPWSLERHERIAIGLMNHRHLYNAVGADWQLRCTGHYS